jgi:hypothetical protein
MGRTYHYDSLPGFVVDWHSINRNSGRQIDWGLVGDNYRSTAFTVTMAAEATATATSLTVDPLPGAVPAGTLLRFWAGEYAYVTEAAAAGDEALTVEAIPATIENGDTATVPGTGAKSIPAGTMMAELASGKIIPRANSSPDTATCLLMASASEKDGITPGNLAYGCIVGGVIYENLLPDYNHASFVTWKGELDNPSVGTGWTWETYADNSGS